MRYPNAITPLDAVKIVGVFLLATVFWLAILS
jgi:hypothetical protein